ncbi:hypothetical protein J1N35_029602 [Gossypium stocksii]|uniref:CCHC-type domain-containing protein n=1 Tax=Gossypium stocksii TaxID=47602 RepID=A0A9D3ZTL8_9ROSI|nr:hypothetical protein J1N35_029602 [Gossypium stocksii]
MLPILPPPLRRPLGRPTKVRRKESDTERLSKRGVEMRCSKCKRIGHNKRSCKGEVGQNIPTLSWCPNSATGYPKLARGYPNSTGCPNSVTYCPNSSRSCPKTKAPIQEKINHNHCQMDAFYSRVIHDRP